MGSNSLFRYADGVDKLLMFFGTLGSLGDGLQNPLMMYILSDVINAYGDTNSRLTQHDVNMVSSFKKFTSTNHMKNFSMICSCLFL